MLPALLFLEEILILSNLDFLRISVLWHIGSKFELPPRTQVTHRIQVVSVYSVMDRLKFCHKYQNYGKCRFWNNCNFIHCSKTEQMLYEVRGTKTQHLEAEITRLATPSRVRCLDHFDKGRCGARSKCKYSHIIQTENDLFTCPVCQNDILEEILILSNLDFLRISVLWHIGSKFELPPRTQVTHRIQVVSVYSVMDRLKFCHKYQNYGKCRFWNNCNFIHCSKTEQMLYEVRGTKTQHLEAEITRLATPSRVRCLDHFDKGRCGARSKCKYSHIIQTENDLFTCPVCQNDILEGNLSFFLTCNHTLCWACLSQLEVSRTRNLQEVPVKTCPMCRTVSQCDRQR
ncbi:hypothetical protein FQR65_LT18705 [Abscondita terminalis]|nr:hypothetical protein FQR65_LT18705 [Abscondita terminalis]